MSFEKQSQKSNQRRNNEGKGHSGMNLSFLSTKGQSKVYFTTWPVQNVTGQLLFLSLSEVGRHLFEADINGAEAFYGLKMKF